MPDPTLSKPEPWWSPVVTESFEYAWIMLPLVVLSLLGVLGSCVDSHSARQQGHDSVACVAAGGTWIDDACTRPAVPSSPTEER